MAYNLLKGKKGLVFGALNEQSIAWKVAQRAVEEGAEIVLTNTPVSIRMGTIDELAKACNAPVIAADATSVKDLENLIDQTMEHFGGKFDFILHSIGMSPNVRKGRTSPKRSTFRPSRSTKSFRSHAKKMRSTIGARSSH